MGAVAMVLGRAAVCSVVHTDSSGVVWPQGACVCVCVCSCLLLVRARRGSHRLNLTRPLTDRAVPSTSACRPVCGAPSDPSALLRRGDAACVPFPQPCGHRPALCRHAARVPVSGMHARCNVCSLDVQCDHSACACYARKLGSPLPLWCWVGSLCGRAWRWDPSSRYLCAQRLPDMWLAHFPCDGLSPIRRRATGKSWDCTCGGFVPSFTAASAGCDTAWCVCQLRPARHFCDVGQPGWEKPGH